MLEEGKWNKRKKGKKDKKNLENEIKEFNTLCLEEVEKYEKKMSLKCMLINLACVVANANIEICYRLILSIFLDYSFILMASSI